MVTGNRRTLSSALARCGCRCETAFQFGGIGALFSHDIDILVTPDPLDRTGLIFEPVFGDEQVLVVAVGHRLDGRRYIESKHVANEILTTYPVEVERLDVFSAFLLPARLRSKRHQVIETTDIMLQMVAALPRWMVDEYAASLPVRPIRLGRKGIHKQIHIGIRERGVNTDFVKSFLQMVRDR